MQCISGSYQLHARVDTGHVRGYGNFLPAGAPGQTSGTRETSGTATTPTEPNDRHKLVLLPRKGCAQNFSVFPLV